MCAENSCKDILCDPAVADHTKKLAKKVLNGWNNGVLDPEPVLVHAGYLQEPNEESHWLFLTMSDEEYNIAGLGIRELHQRPDASVVVVEEVYPIFPEPKIGHFQMVKFKERKNLSQRKDSEAWEKYMTSGANRLFIYRRKEYPTVWICLPDPPAIKVYLWIYDFAGHMSEPVPLEYGLPRRKMKRP